MFGLFSPSRNYHLQAVSDTDAKSWVDAIRTEARIDEEEEESMILSSPLMEGNMHQNLGQRIQQSKERLDQERLASSSPEPKDKNSRATTRDGVRIPGIRRTPVHEMEYSGAEHGSVSDFSDTAPSRMYRNPASSFPNLAPSNITSAYTGTVPVNTTYPARPAVGRKVSQQSIQNTENEDPERIIWHGYLLALKSKGGVRQWKNLWVVLRPKSMAFYKDEEEYSAHLLIPMGNILSAVEIDPVSKSKAHCLQIIAEEKSYRLCAHSEEALARCLGALKSQLAKRKEKGNTRRTLQ